MADEVTLLDFWASPFGMRVKIALAEKGVKYEYSEQDLRDKSALLLQMNPVYKKIPVLVHRGKPVIHDLSRKIWTTKGEEMEEAKKGFFECLELLEGELGEKPYFGGETLGYVDIAFLPFCCGFSTYETIGNFSIEAQCPKIIAWANRCLQKESVAKSLAEPGKVHELVLEIRKSLGFD
uniref:glutathione transferase n=1 Tax=Populus yatungensis TaxID=1393210 RepID=A0A193KWY6_9ROSI|nr:glutathione S-transferase U31 [Populus yatungensis]